MATSKIQHHRDVIDALLEKADPLLSDLGLGKASSNRDDPRLEPNFVRRAVSRLPEETEITAGLADLWLDLSMAQGAHRRRTEPPASPFQKQGRKLVAEIAKIADWDLSWRLVELADQIRRSHSKKGASIADLILRQAQPMLQCWIGGEARIVGAAAWLPPTAQDLPIEQLDAVWLRPEQALRRRWLDKEEANRFLMLVRAAQQVQYAELEDCQRSFNTAEAEGRPRDLGDRRL